MPQSEELAILWYESTRRKLPVGRLVFAVVVIIICDVPIGFAQSHTLSVSKPTKIDSTFVLANQSLTELPEGWLPSNYESTEQRYDIVSKSVCARHKA